MAFDMTLEERFALMDAAKGAFDDVIQLWDLHDDPDELVAETERLLLAARILQVLKLEDDLTPEMLQPLRPRIKEYREFAANHDGWSDQVPVLDVLLARIGGDA